MSLTYEDNPFRPDFGGIPPLLAGRVKEKRTLDTGLKQLQKCIPPITVLISAPRGMGKSVLLNVLNEKANRLGIEFRKKHAGDIETVQQLTEWLAPDLVEAARGRGRNVGGGIPALATVHYGSTAGPALGEPAWDVRLQDALLERYRDKPLVICVDEAHTLRPPVARSLGSLRHQLNDRKRPVWLLLAGTPGLNATLSNADATFTERVTDLAPPMLSGEDSATALRSPLATRGWQVDEDALSKVVEDSRGYPYFLQLWGKEIWDAGVACSEARLDADTVENAGVEVAARRNQFYNRRYKELMGTRRNGPFDDVDIVAVTQAVIDAVRRQQGASLLDIDNAISEHLPPRGNPAPIRQYYEATGFIWDPEPDRYQPGIPSLVDYIEDKIDQRSAPVTGITW